MEKMAVSVADKRKAKSVKALETIINSEQSTPTAVIQATRALAQIDAKHVEKQAKPLETMTRAEIQSELRRVQALID